MKPKALESYTEYMRDALARARAIYNKPSAVPVPPRVTTSQCAPVIERLERVRRNVAMDELGWRSA